MIYRLKVNIIKLDNRYLFPHWKDIYQIASEPAIRSVWCGGVLTIRISLEWPQCLCLTVSWGPSNYPWPPVSQPAQAAAHNSSRTVLSDQLGDWTDWDLTPPPSLYFSDRREQRGLSFNSITYCTYLLCHPVAVYVGNH